MTDDVKSDEPKEADNDHIVREIPLEYVIPEGFGFLFSDQAFIQNTENEFILNFFQSGLPLVQSKEDLQKVESLRAYCVARIVLTPAQMFRLANAITGNIKKYQERFDQKKDE